MLLFTLNTDSLYILRDTYVNEINFLKGKYVRDTEYVDEFVLNYINNLECEIHSINCELIHRGEVK